MIHVSCWDAFAGAKGDPGDERTLTKRFSEAIGGRVALVSTGSIWTESDAEFVIDQGADVIGVARAAIGHADWANNLGGGDYEPERPPFTPDHLLEEGLSPVFIDYMRRWQGFVSDGRK